MTDGDPASEGTAKTLDQVYAHVWSLLEEGARQRSSPFHTPTLATVGADGTPQARTVVLREAVRKEQRLRFNTDLRAPKHFEMAADGRIALHVYDAARKTQVRVSGTVMLSAGDAHASDVWAGMRAMSRECYRQGCAPGSVLESPQSFPRDALDDATALGNFVVADVTVETLDWLYLLHSGHVRAGFDLRQSPVKAEWRAP